MKRLVTLILAVLLLAVLAVAASAAVGTVVYAKKVNAAPNMEKIDASWGEPVIHVDKNSPNTRLFDYWSLHPEKPEKQSDIHCEDVYFDLYLVWTDKYLYIGMVSEDPDITGAAPIDCGDGMEFWLQGLAGMEASGMATKGLYRLGEGRDDPNQYSENALYRSQSVNIYMATLGFDDWTVSEGKLEGYSGFGSDECEKNMYQEDNIIHCMMEIPLANMGVTAKNALNAELGIAFLRMSLNAKGAEDPATPRTGWLEWGKYYMNGKNPNATCNTIILTDGSVPAETEDTTPPATEDTEVETPINLEGVSSWALTEVEAGIKEGLVPENLQANYTSPVSRGAVAGMFINLIEKATGKTIDEVMAEKGVSITEGVFEDTTDRNVLAANALGIINGTSKTKFSPNGTLKRAQIAAIINRVARVLGIETEGFTHEFNDITDNYAWADSELGWPVHAGIINGVGQGRFNPGGDLTTEQAILITYRGLSALKK
jgi:hypothetical protein